MDPKTISEQDWKWLCRAAEALRWNKGERLAPLSPFALALREAPWVVATNQELIHLRAGVADGSQPLTHDDRLELKVAGVVDDIMLQPKHPVDAEAFIQWLGEEQPWMTPGWLGKVPINRSLLAGSLRTDRAPPRVGGLWVRETSDAFDTTAVVVGDESESWLIVLAGLMPNARQDDDWTFFRLV